MVTAQVTAHSVPPGALQSPAGAAATMRRVSHARSLELLSRPARTVTLTERAHRPHCLSLFSLFAAFMNSVNTQT